MRGPIRLAGACWWLAEDAAPDAAPLRELLAEIARREARGALPALKRGRRKALYEIGQELGLAGADAADREGPRTAPSIGPAPGAGFLLKVTRYGRLDGLRRRLRGSKARRELALAERVRARGLPAPLPLAAGERRRGPRLEACLLLIPRLPHVTDLRALLAEDALAPAARRRLAVAFGALARRIADAGLFQDDFQPNNFLVDRRDPQRLHVIDFERARLYPRLDARARRFMLAKLARELPDAPAGERLRFLIAYAGERRAARRLWRDVEAEARRLAARDLARMGRTATRPGRRFRRLREGGARGFAHGDDPAARALAGAPAAPGLAPHPEHWALTFARCDARRARELWVRQAWLAARDLAAAPRVLLRHPDGRTTLVVARRKDEQLLGEAPSPDAEAAFRRLRVRTRELGRLEPADAAREPVAIAPGRGGRLRARWLCPPVGLRVGPR